MTRGWRIGLGFVLGVVILCVAATVWFAAMLSGGFDDLINLDRPTESSPKVVAARERTVQQVEERLGSLVSTTQAATGLRLRPGATLAGDWCDEGQHNWKVDDDYDLLCTADRTALLLGDEGRAAAELTSLVEWLDRAGYEPAYEGAGVEPRLNGDTVVSDDELGTGGMYESGDRGWRIEVELLAADSPAYRMPRSGDPLSRLQVDGSPVEGGFPPSGLVPPGQYGVWLTLSAESFRD